MDSARWRQVQEIFHAALEQPETQREEFLSRACGDDEPLRRDVGSLLAAHDTQGMVGALADDVPPPVVEQIGPYRVVAAVGEGGMGSVYLAERTGAGFTQRVALKVLRAGFADPRLEERLRQERRILAGLEHPGIARLIDGGATEAGQPYYAMEFVEGTSLIAYCDANRLTVSQRLRLALEICDAVYHAHQQLVVHRDLKPSNILVTPEGRPKLLDFGIAKMLDPTQGPEGATRTAPFFSPQYASPEQVRGDPVGTRSDVYALGVLLYEMLSGERPYEIDTRSPAEIQRIVCETVPERPSARTGRARLRKLLMGDLDTIVMKAMAKEPARRYGSVEQLAEDIRRHLENRPVLARPDSVGYRLSKFFQRHRTTVGAAAVVTISLIGGVVTAAWQAQRATTERDRAAEEAEKAALITDLMVDLFRLSDPTETRGDTLTARQILDRGTERIEEELIGQPDVQAAVFTEVARVYANLGLFDRAEALARRSLALSEALYGPGSLEISPTVAYLGDLLRVQGRNTDAVDLYRRAIAIRERTVSRPDSLLAQTQANLGWLLRELGQYDEAAALFAAALTDQQQLFGEARPDVASTLFGLAATYHDKGSFDRAEAVFERAVARYDTTGRPHPLAATAVYNVGMLRRLREQYRDALPLLQSAVSMRRSLFDEDHPEVIDAETQLAIVKQSLGHYREVVGTLAALLDRAARTLGYDHPQASTIRTAYASLLTETGRFDEADSQYDTLLLVKRARLAPTHEDLLFATLRSSEPSLEAGRLAAASARLDTLAAGLSAGPSVLRLLMLQRRGRIAHRQGRLAEAGLFYDESLALARDLLRETHRYTLDVQRDRAELLLDRGRVTEAIGELEAVLAGERSTRPSPHPRIGYTLHWLGEAQLALGTADSAARLFRRALEHLGELPGWHWRVGRTKSLLGAALRWQGRENEAIELLVDGLEIIRAHLGRGAPEAHRIEALLASAPQHR